MISRVTSAKIFVELMRAYPWLTGLSPREWFDDPGNTALIDENENLFLLEGEEVPSLHYFFKSRGRDAVRAAKAFLAYYFDGGGRAVKGLTPVDKKGARWLSRQIGGKSYGIVYTIHGDFELFILTKEEHYEFNSRGQ